MAADLSREGPYGSAPGAVQYLGGRAGMARASGAGWAVPGTRAAAVGVPAVTASDRDEVRVSWEREREGAAIPTSQQFRG